MYCFLTQAVVWQTAQLAQVGGGLDIRKTGNFLVSEKVSPFLVTHPSPHSSLLQHLYTSDFQRTFHRIPYSPPRAHYKALAWRKIPLWISSWTGGEKQRWELLIISHNSRKLQEEGRGRRLCQILHYPTRSQMGLKRQWIAKVADDTASFPVAKNKSCLRN